MASPHVAGLAAYFLSLSPSPMSPQQVRTKILSAATSGAVGDLLGSPNILANHGY
jgi:subtilisin family serine protease